MRHFCAQLLIVVTLLAPNLAFGQDAVRSSTERLRPEERPIVKAAVQNVHDSYKRSRTADGVGGIAAGLLTGGIGAYLWVTGSNNANPENAVTLQIIGIGIALSAVPQLVSGVWNIFYDTPQEEISAKLLNDDELLDGAGILFVEQEARRAKRQRLVGGTTSIAQGLSILGSYYLYAQVFGGIDILLLFFGIAAALQTVGGVIQLVGLSGPERAYRDLLGNLGRSEEAPQRHENRISRFNLVPTLLANEGKLAPGAGFSLSF